MIGVNESIFFVTTVSYMDTIRIYCDGTILGEHTLIDIFNGRTGFDFKNSNLNFVRIGYCIKGEFYFMTHEEAKRLLKLSVL